MAKDSCGDSIRKVLSLQRSLTFVAVPTPSLVSFRGMADSDWFWVGSILTALKAKRSEGVSATLQDRAASSANVVRCSAHGFTNRFQTNELGTAALALSAT